MKIARTARFKKAWGQLTGAEKESARKAISNLSSNIRYPSLRARKIKGAENIWEARVRYSLRMTFQIEGSTIILRNIGRHNATLGRP
jgi:mRNA interferase RelE/StbE